MLSFNKIFMEVEMRDKLKVNKLRYISDMYAQMFMSKMSYTEFETQVEVYLTYDLENLVFKYEDGLHHYGKGNIDLEQPMVLLYNTSMFVNTYRNQVYKNSRYKDIIPSYKNSDFRNFEVLKQGLNKYIKTDLHNAIECGELVDDSSARGTMLSLTKVETIIKNLGSFMNVEGIKYLNREEANVLGRNGLRLFTIEQYKTMSDGQLRLVTELYIIKQKDNKIIKFEIEREADVTDEVSIYEITGVLDVKLGNMEYRDKLVMYNSRLGEMDLNTNSYSTKEYINSATHSFAFSIFEDTVEEDKDTYFRGIVETLLGEIKDSHDGKVINNILRKEIAKVLASVYIS